MRRARRGFPGAAEIGQPRLDAFDIEPDRAAAGKHQLDRCRPARSAGLKLIASSDSTSAGLSRSMPAGLGRKHAVEMQHAAAPLGALGAAGRLPASQASRFMAMTNRWAAGMELRSPTFSTAS